MNFENYKHEIQKEGLNENQYIIGIDLGTTHSVISYWNGTKQLPEAIDMSQGFGKIPMPSVVQWRKEGLDEEWIIGTEALNSYMIYPETTVRSIKNKMGQHEVITLDYKEFTPEDLSAKILKALLEQIRSMNPKSEIVGAVVSVPYDFDDAAKKATIQACHLAGLSETLIALIEEPKAAAMAYNYEHPFKEKERLMVFDFGGGTLDITIFEVQSISEKEQTLKVLSEGGQAHHGGDVLDELIYDYFIDVMGQKGINQENLSKEALAELKIKAKETKERLSGVQKVRIPMTMLNPPFMLTMTRDELKEIGKSFILKTKYLIEKSLDEGYKGALSAKDIDRILLEGGSSQMPWVREIMEEVFGDRDKIYASDRPALDISLGATLYASMKMGVHEQKDVVTGNKKVNFEVCVPHDIGFEVDIDAKKIFYCMISRGTPYRLARRSQVFTIQGATEEDMTSLSVRILERIHHDRGVEDCSLIGDVMVSGLPKRPMGETQIKVELSIEEMTGTVKGLVEDIGYQDKHAPSGFRQSFVPTRHSQLQISDER